MNRVFSKWWLLVLFSSILAFLNVCKIEFVAAWICLVPLFICSINSNANKSFCLGFVFGLFFSVFSFFWVIAGLQTFTGRSFIYGIVASVLI
jgi:apolipoprotein N-acyltransferase